MKLARMFSVACVIGCAAVRVIGQQGAANGEWRSYGGDLGHTRYSPLDQINASNFSTLEVAWRFKTDSLGPRPEYQLEGTPLMVGGLVYATAGTRRAVVALDAATGELAGCTARSRGARGANAPRQFSGRGLAYWSDGRESRILYVTPGYRLVALDAKTGALVPGFGVNGIVDLKKDDDQEIDLDHRGSGAARDADGREGRRDRRRRASLGRRAARTVEREGLRARLRRPHRQAPVDLPHDPDAGRVRQRHVGKRLVVLHRQHRRVGADLDRRGARDCVPARRTADRRLLRRAPARRRAVRREPGRRRSADRQTQVALSVRPPRPLGHGSAVRADPRRHSDQRPDGEGGRSTDQAGVALRLRSGHGSADLADRGTAGAEGRHRRASGTRRRSRI